MVLPFEIGFRKTKEYLWTGDVIPLREAERLGMINRIVPDDRLDAEALKMAERIRGRIERTRMLTQHH